MSTTDPDSGFLMREGKPKGFHYLDHRTVDAKYNIITDTYITAGNMADSEPYLARLQEQMNKFGFQVEAVALDAGYFTNYICKKLTEQRIFMVMGYRRFGKSKQEVPRRFFQYVKQIDKFACPMGCILTYCTTDREGQRQYKSNPADCAVCPLRSGCFSANQTCRRINRHVWEEYKELALANKRTSAGTRLYKLRSSTIERSFADAKELHGYRYARFRGRESVQMQAYLTAACQNMKKIAFHLAKKNRVKSDFFDFTFMHVIFCHASHKKSCVQGVFQHSENKNPIGFLFKAY
ncbi:hypothetical protein BTI247_37650 [Bacillus thuringiensis Bt18247]|uniref:Transposase DDE domain-containing protein n=1 Tax=Bacillus thuringiensis Bt18247 TaxID=1423143 RepID=A0A9W3SUX7_BACTU|nr:hypothetical protein BTI247_37650 [Bacillus thuringiensis Bt18247]